ncbi:MAG: putative porin [Elusimicrobia bacterium]|nr:putative porin [Elusimicrobiota bacterium]
MHFTKRSTAVLMAFAAAITATSARAGEITISSDKLEIKGDLRLRHQTNEETANSNRDRQRIRLRLGMNYTVNPMLAVKTQFATGGAEQTSTNQTLDSLSKPKGIFLDLAYLELKPLPGAHADTLVVSGGRMKNPLWQTYSSDLVWDSDLNPEGLGENVKLSLAGFGRVFVNASQWVVNEKKKVADSASLAGNRPQYVFSTQAGVILPASMDSRFTLAGSIHDWVNETDRAFGDGVSGSTNLLISTTTDKLANDFRVIHIDAEWFTTIPGVDLPLSIQGAFVKNTAHRDNLFANNDKRDTGHQVGAILGSASNPNSWEIAYFNKSVDQDAVVSDASDSDFPGTNRKGNIFWVAYAPWKNQQVKVKLFQTSIIEGAEKDIDTLQLDWQVKF